MLLNIILLFTVLASSHAIAWSEQNSHQLSAAIDAGEYQTVTSVLIHHHGETLYEQYFHGTDANTLHDTRSASKTVASILLGIAIKRKEIRDVHMPVVDFFSELQPLKNPDPRKSDITIEDFLTMSSRLECNDFNPYSRGNEERMYVLEDWVKFTLDLPIKGYAPWETKPEDSPFRRSFAYCTAGAYTLGQIVARASNRELSDYAREYLFEPLDIKAVEWPRTSLGKASTAGGIRLSTRSLLKLGLLYIDGSHAQEKNILSREWIEQSLKSHAAVDSDHEYGYLIWKRASQIGDTKVTSHFMSGNGGNHIVMIPDHKLVVVITKTDFNQRGAHDAARRLVDEAILPNIVH